MRGDNDLVGQGQDVADHDAQGHLDEAGVGIYPEGEGLVASADNRELNQSGCTRQ